MKVGIKDISKRTGFSTATVSNALNHKKGVNPETAAEVIKVAKEMGYISESRIMKLRLAIFKRNGRIIEDSPFFSLIVDGIEKECRESGLEMILCYLNYEDEDYEEQVKRLIYNNSSAVILLGTELMEEDVALFKGATCPFLMLDYWSWEMDFHGVVIANADSARMAVNYLIQNGHTEIGYLRGDFRIKAFRSRAVGYATALKKAGIAANKDYTVTLGTNTTTAYQDMLAYLQAGHKLPTAFFADDDMIALGAIRALQEMGCRVPEDVSVIGFDDLPYAEIANPPLTTIRVPKHEMGSIAVKEILDIMNNSKKIKIKTQVTTSLIERESVRRLYRQGDA